MNQMNGKSFFASVCVAILVLSSPNLKAQSQEFEWDIEEVTVYQQGARIVRSGPVSLDNQGRLEFELVALAQSIDPEMIQVAMPAGWSVVSSVFHSGPKQSEWIAATKALAQLENDERENRRTFSLRSALKASYEEELLMIQANRKVSGNELLLVEDLTDHANFWRQRVKELQYLMLELEMEMTALDGAYAEIQDSKSEWNDRMNSQEGKIALRLSGPKNASGLVRVSYVAIEAMWQSTYEAEVDSDGSIRMQRFVQVSQSTGSDWDVIPTFFAGNPLQTLMPPALDTKWLSIHNNGTANSYSWEASLKSADRMDSSPMSSFDGIRAQAGGGSVSSGPLERFSFKPAFSARIPGDGSKERLYIDSFELEGELTYLVLPEMSDEAYQLAKSAAWSQASLMPGRVQVMADGIFRGGFFMNLPNPGDTLQIPLGQDGRVRSNRTRLFEQCASSVFGNNRKTTQVFEIEVENQHGRAIDALVVDRVPRSNSSDIQVDIIELGGGQFDETTGEVTWRLHLEANERRRLQFSYEVTFPKRKALNGL